MWNGCWWAGDIAQHQQIISEDSWRGLCGPPHFRYHLSDNFRWWNSIKPWGSHRKMSDLLQGTVSSAFSVDANESATQTAPTACRHPDGHVGSLLETVVPISTTKNKPNEWLANLRFIWCIRPNRHFKCSVTRLFVGKQLDSVKMNGQWMVPKNISHILESIWSWLSLSRMNKFKSSLTGGWYSCVPGHTRFGQLFQFGEARLANITIQESTYLFWFTTWSFLSAIICMNHETANKSSAPYSEIGLMLLVYDVGSCDIKACQAW